MDSLAHDLQIIRWQIWFISLLLPYGMEADDIFTWWDAFLWDVTSLLVVPCSWWVLVIQLLSCIVWCLVKVWFFSPLIGFNGWATSIWSPWLLMVTNSPQFRSHPFHHHWDFWWLSGSLEIHSLRKLTKNIICYATRRMFSKVKLSKFG